MNIMDVKISMFADVVVIWTSKNYRSKNKKINRKRHCILDLKNFALDLRKTTSPSVNRRQYTSSFPLNTINTDFDLKLGHSFLENKEFGN